VTINTFSFETSPNTKPTRKSGGTWHIMSHPPKKVGGHVPRVPHQIAPMCPGSYEQYLSSIILGYLAAKKSGILDQRRFLCDWSISCRHSVWKAMLSRHLTEYNTLRNNALHTHTQHNGLKPWCGGVP